MSLMIRSRVSTPLMRLKEINNIDNYHDMFGLLCVVVKIEILPPMGTQIRVILKNVMIFVCLVPMSC